MPGEPPRTDQPGTRLRADAQDDIVLDVRLPAGWLLHPGQTFMYRIAQTSGQVKLDMRKRKGILPKPKFPIKIPFTPPQGHSEVLVQTAFYYCPKNNLDECKAFSRYFLIPVDGAADEKSRKVALLVRPDQY